MIQRLHPTLGGESADPPENLFGDAAGTFPGHRSAHDAWNAKARRMVDTVYTRHFIARRHRPPDE
ncbi:MAG: DUF4170 domain-containing protein [Pseudomonadota bacterium]